MTDKAITIWKREMIRFVRSKSRVFGSLGTPFFLLLILGLGLDQALSFKGVSYSQFLGSGILGMVLMTSSIVFGIMIIWDRQFGFLKEMLVAPIPRLSIMAGKTLGGMTIAMLQALIMFVVVILMGTSFPGFSTLAYIIAVMALISLGFTASGIAIASKMRDFHGFQIIMNFLIMPLFFLSGAVFPIESLPLWIRYVSMIDPLTYGVDAIRFFLLGFSSFSILTDITVLILFAAAALAIGTHMFSQSEA